MNGSEGKINPGCSLHTYLEVAPEAVSYNFACRLEEYCVNSETRYAIHDQEHIIKLGHFAGLCFKKLSAEQISQEHFMFFVQYLI